MHEKIAAAPPSLAASTSAGGTGGIAAISLSPIGVAAHRHHLLPAARLLPHHPCCPRRCCWTAWTCWLASDGRPWSSAAAPPAGTPSALPRSVFSTIFFFRITPKKKSASPRIHDMICIPIRIRYVYALRLCVYGTHICYIQNTYDIYICTYTTTRAWYISNDNLWLNKKETKKTMHTPLLL